MIDRRALLAATAALAAAPARAQPAEAPLRLPDMPLHDPFIVADTAARTYHLFTKNERAMTGEPAVGTMAYTSRDLGDWTRPRPVFTLPRGIWANDGAWAPEVHRHGDRWYLFTTLHNESALINPSRPERQAYRRATILAASESLRGPFRVVRDAEPIAPADRMTLDGTLHVEPDGQRWSVYAREWIQTGVGRMEAVPLDETLRASGPPIELFRANDAPWPTAQRQPQGDDGWVTDGPQLFRTRTGRLLMLWSSWGADGYAQALARSTSGTIVGPWEQLPVLLAHGSGHGMLFRTFDGALMLVLHRPFKNARGKIYEMRDTGDTVEIIRQRTDLDGG